MLVIFANLWIWRAFVSNFPVFVALVMASVVLIKAFDNKKYIKFVLITFGALLLWQAIGTQRQDLQKLDNDQIRVQDTRLNEYPPINFPLAYWLEARPETVAFSRVRDNFFEQLDLNLYFFAAHPRERVGVDEFEKFPYILLPFFGVGIFVAWQKYKFLLVALLTSIIAASLIGINNHLGNFSIFPPLVGLVYLGLKKTYDWVPIKFRKLSIIIFAISFVLAFMQIYLYETA